MDIIGELISTGEGNQKKRREESVNHKKDKEKGKG
jgi:hypothetical protein